MRLKSPAASRGDAQVFVGPMRVDVFFDCIPVHGAAATRTVSVKLHGRPARVLSPEDTAVLEPRSAGRARERSITRPISTGTRREPRQSFLEGRLRRRYRDVLEERLRRLGLGEDQG